MSKLALQIVSDAMREMGLTYGFVTYNGNPVVYPYFVGEYAEEAPVNEDGMQATTFLITGFSRGSWLALEDAREQIERYFGMVSGKTVVADNGSAAAVFYERTLVIPTDDAELKRIEINLHIKEWKVNA